MAAQSGKNGNVVSGSDDIAHVTNWTWNPSSNNPDWASSDTSGYKKRVAGIKDGTGTVDFKYDFTDRIHSTLDVGSEVTLKLYLNATDYFSVPAIVDDISYEVNINEGDVVGGTLTFSQNGEWTNPS